MNTIQLKVLIKSIQVSHIGQDSKLLVTGDCKFQHYDSTAANKKTTCILKYKAFGYAARTLENIKVNTTCIISGSLDIYPPNDKISNHQAILNITRAIPVNILDTNEYNSVVSKPTSTKEPVASNTTDNFDDSVLF